MEKVQLFNNEQFDQLRVVSDNGKVFFNLSDVCKALAIGNPSDTKRRLEKRGVVSIDTPTFNQHGTRVMQPMTYIDEPNLYRCIFQSRKAEAQRFQEWMRDHGFLGIRSGAFYNTPYQQWVEADLFAVEVQTHITRCGHVFTNYVTRVTPKGQRYFLNGFLNGKFTI